MGSFDMYIRNLGPWSGGLEYRYLGNYPLSSGAGIYNLLDTHADAMQYWYVGRLQGEPADGAAGLQVHPLEPTSYRLTLSKTFRHPA